MDGKIYSVALFIASSFLVCTGHTNSALASINLLSPSEGEEFTACSYYDPPICQWEADETFKSLEFQFSSRSDFSTKLVKVKGSLTINKFQIKPSLWKKVLLLPGIDGGTVYYRAVGKKADKTKIYSNPFWIEVREPEHIGCPIITPTTRESLPTLSWQNNCNVKFKVWFSSDPNFTKRGLKKKALSFKVTNPNNNEGIFTKTLTSAQWASIRKLVGDENWQSIYWYVESWDVGNRHSSSEVFSFTLGAISETIGPEGGIIEVTDPASPMYGSKIEIPLGALEENVTINITPLSKSDVELQIGSLSEDMRFFGGIRVEGNGITLKKPIGLSIDNSLGADPADQLLIGQITNIDNKDLSEVVYKGVAHTGSPIGFSITELGSFAVLSPTTNLGLINGTFVTPSDDPISNGLIATSFSTPFLATTNQAGYFEIPAGPAGSYAAVMGIPLDSAVPNPVSPTGGVGLTHAQLPEILPIPPTSLIDLGVKIVMDQIDVPEPPVPDPCPCDPPPLSPFFTSKEYPEPPFELCPEETIQTYLFSLEGVYGGNVSPWPNIVDLTMSLPTGTLSVSSMVSFWTEDPSIATVDPVTGQLTGKSTGETVLNAKISIIKLKNCSGYGFGYVKPCFYYDIWAIPAKVKVGKLIIKNESPTGDIPTGNLTISAIVESLWCNNVDIKQLQITMILDGLSVKTTRAKKSDNEIQVSHKTTSDNIGEGEHTVILSVSDTTGKLLAEKSWTFTICADFECEGGPYLCYCMSDPDNVIIFWSTTPCIDICWRDIIEADYCDAYSVEKLHDCLCEFLPVSIPTEPEDEFQKELEEVEKRIEKCEDRWW